MAWFAQHFNWPPSVTRAQTRRDLILLSEAEKSRPRRGD